VIPACPVCRQAGGRQGICDFACVGHTMNVLYAILASIFVSLISLVGVFTIILNDNLLKKILIFLVAFAAGGLMGGAFLHILPEAMESAKNINQLFLYVIVGFLLFFVLEKYLYWHHCHDMECDLHMFTYLNIVGDIVHNFSDGLIMGAIFMTNVKLGITATLAIVFHEIPHELGNFMVLIYGGFGKFKALFYNFLSSLFAVAGTLVGCYFANKIKGFSSVLLPIAVGGFIYIAACDLIPELHKEHKLKRSIFTIVAFSSGITLMYFLKVLF
jgi:zinc and cadmium transporter